MSDQIRASIDNLGQFGMVFDSMSHQLPPNAMTFGQNISFRRGAIHSAHGRKEALGQLQVAPTFLMAMRIDGDISWIYAGEYKLYTATWNGTSWDHVERTGTTTPTSNDWQGTILGGIAILNNGVDVPQVWYGNGNFVDLSDWPTGITAKVITAYKNFLVAGNITDSSTSPITEYSNMLWWSDAAEPGQVPPAWEPANNNLADKQILTSGGQILDIKPLQSVAVIYTESTCWGLQYGGNSFSLNSIFNTLGVLSNNCVVDIGSQHVVLTDSDLVIHDGNSTPSSLIKDRSRNWLFDQIDPDSYQNCFLIHNSMQNEVWCCFPEIGQIYANKALIVDYITGTNSLRNLGGYSCGAIGPVIGEDETWNADNNEWNSDLTSWDEVSASASRSQIYMCDPTKTKVFMEDVGYEDAGNNIVAYVERSSLLIPDSDNTVFYLIQQLYPWVNIVGFEELEIYIGSQYYLEDAIEWSGPYSFHPSTQSKVDVMVSGRYFTFKFKWNAKGKFSISRIDFDYVTIGHAWK